MAGATHSVPPEQQLPSPADRLDSWKEIAAHLKRSARTVRRWETEQSLPVHRHVHKAGSTVYAFKSELDSWWTSRRDDLEVSTDSTEASVTDALPASVSRSRFLHWPLVAIITPMALLLFLGVYRFRHSVPRSGNRVMLVVLPFENLGPSPGQEYVNDGLTEETITQLGKLDPERLGVIARSSAMRYKDAHARIDRIGKELHVDYILEGSIRQQGGRARITAQLIRVTDQTQVWAASYDRDIHDLLTVQDEIAQAITHSIQIKLTPHSETRLARTAAANPEAHDAYLMGRYLWDKRTPEALGQAISHFNRAVSIDPNYAVAYAGLADCYVVLPIYTTTGADEDLTRAKAAATKALQIDPELGEAYAAMAAVSMERWEWADAASKFRRAIELAPNDATAHLWYAGYLQEIGRLDQAATELQRADALDPLSVSVNKAIAYQFYIQRQYDASLAQSRKVLELEPLLPGFHNQIGLTYWAKGMLNEAAAQFREARAISRDDPWSVMYLGNVQAALGKPEETRTALRELQVLNERRHVSPFYFGILHIALGEKDQGFELLNKAIDEHDDSITWTESNPAFDSLHTDPRYGFLLKRMNFPVN